ncbi:MAG: hypothetical protein IPF57_03855 [Gammaproteobacteria bacterium]|nr:hypothetical protein [Gammaproteobacteria bacterium]
MIAATSRACIRWSCGLSTTPAAPDATRDEVLAAGTEVRREVYGWLMKTSRRRAGPAHPRLAGDRGLSRNCTGNGSVSVTPFASLTPSLATAIGSSGDRPAALAG